MNRIENLFKEKKERVLSVYMTAGFPKLNDTVDIIRGLQNSGVDLIEIGMPFSDPLADGPVIQKSSHQALQNGMSLKILFEQLKDVRANIDVPLLLMGYLNPVLQFGIDAFIEKCSDVGIDGLIIPDLPLDVYNKEFRSKIEQADLSFVMLITPQTSEDRIHEVAKTSRGFLYMVADSSTTGVRDGINKHQLEYFDRIKRMNLEIPRLVGFGISNAESFLQASKYAHGAIIGSAFIRALEEEEGNKLEDRISGFIKSIIP